MSDHLWSAIFGVIVYLSILQGTKTKYGEMLEKCGEDGVQNVQIEDSISLNWKLCDDIDLDIAIIFWENN